MKQECAVVQDLMVLYEDDVLRDESRKIVQEHIRTCEECRKIYERASAPVSGIQDALPDIRESLGRSEKDREDMAVKAVSRFRRKLTFNHIIIGGLLFIAFILITNLAGYLVTDGIGSIFTGMPAKEIEVKEIYRLKNGEIYLAVSSQKSFQLSHIPVLESAERHQDTDGAYYHLSFTKAYGWLAKLRDLAGVQEAAYIFPTETGVKDYLKQEEEYRWSCNEIACVGPLKQDKKVLWKKGEEVSEAPPEIEEKAIAAYVQNGDFQKAREEMERNKELGGIDIYKVYEKYYPDGASSVRDWWQETACEVYEKPDGQAE